MEQKNKVNEKRFLVVTLNRETKKIRRTGLSYGRRKEAEEACVVNNMDDSREPCYVYDSKTRSLFEITITSKWGV